MFECSGDQDEDLHRMRLSLLDPRLEVVEPSTEVGRPIDLHNPNYDTRYI
jgi:hypothetical protein